LQAIIAANSINCTRNLPVIAGPHILLLLTCFAALQGSIDKTEA